MLSDSCSECASPVDSDSDNDALRWGGRSSPDAGRDSLLFEYCESRSPHTREPLTEAIARLAEGAFPGLAGLRSCDIHPASWFSVAWYPIASPLCCASPASGRAARELGASFLTFHSLAAPLATQPGVAAGAGALAGVGGPPGGNAAAPPGKLMLPDGRPAPPAPSPAADAEYERRAGAAAAAACAPAGACLRPFACVPYKMYGRTWEDDRRAGKLTLQLAAAAGAWVRGRGVAQPDLDFFLSNLRPR